jgi:hypothetical protein
MASMTSAMAIAFLFFDFIWSEIIVKIGEIIPSIESSLGVLYGVPMIRQLDGLSPFFLGVFLCQGILQQSNLLYAKILKNYESFHIMSHFHW